MPRPMPENILLMRLSSALCEISTHRPHYSVTPVSRRAQYAGEWRDRGGADLANERRGFKPGNIQNRNAGVRQGVGVHLMCPQNQISNYIWGRHLEYTKLDGIHQYWGVEWVSQIQTRLIYALNVHKIPWPQNRHEARAPGTPFRSALQP
jgi:hypothetical protein